MRVDAFNRVSQLYQANSTKKTMSAGKKGAKDCVEISRLGQEFRQCQDSRGKGSGYKGG